MVDNSNIPYTVYIAEDVADYLQGSQLPENITVKIGIPSFEKTKKIRLNISSTDDINQNRLSSYS